jgi:hypothetical protein
MLKKWLVHFILSILIIIGLVGCCSGHKLFVYRIRHYNEPKNSKEISQLSNRNTANILGLAYYLTNGYCDRFNAHSMAKDKIYRYAVRYIPGKTSDFGTYINCDPRDGYHGKLPYYCNPKNTNYCKDTKCKVKDNSTYISFKCLQTCPATGDAHGVGRSQMATESAVYWYSFPLSGECRPDQSLGDDCGWKFESIVGDPVDFKQLQADGFKCGVPFRENVAPIEKALSIP